ncbi:MAG TPA: hypothetical protein VMV49_11495, partial [Candidatus Deferrimicrobium sp.]|nr:hypothetical protein [Candidatus Deferrimicrobium sp.]
MQKKLILPLIFIGLLMCSGLLIFSSEKIQSNQITNEKSDSIVNKSEDNFDYLGKYSFTNDADGGNPTEWTVDEPGGSHVNVIPGLDGHHKVVELYRSDSNAPNTENTFPSKAASSGYEIEFWIRGDPNSQWYIDIGDGGHGFDSKIWIHFNFFTNECRNYINGGSTSVLVSAIYPDRWYHFRLQITGSLTFNIWVDGVSKGTFNGWFSQAAFDRILFGSYLQDGNYKGYIDAVDYSWEAGYYINRNMDYQSTLRDYMGKYSFTNDSDGGNPTEWTVDEPGGSYVNVISEMDGHHKVV